MSESTNKTDAYRKALALAESGRHEQALSCIREHLLANPRDGQALNDAGAILFAMGRIDEAAEHLRMALEHLPGDPPETLWNLAEVCLSAGRPDEVAGLFERLERVGLLNPDLMNRAATAYVEAGRPGHAIEMLLRSMKAGPKQEVVLKPIMEQIRRTRPKMAFFCPPELAGVADPLRRFFEERFCIRAYHGSAKRETLDRLQWCRLAWFESCTELLASVTSIGKRFGIIVRLHAADAFDQWITHVQWDKVDAVVLTAGLAAANLIRQRVPQLERLTRLVHVRPCVDLDRIAFVERSAGKNLACIGDIRHAQGIVLLLQCIARLRQADPGYKLFIAGEFRDAGLEQYVATMLAELKLQEAVVLGGFQDDPQSWLADKQFVVSANVVDGDITPVLEAMAAGLKPVVHTFGGSRDFFADEHLFSTVEQFCDRVLGGRYDSREHRGYVEQRFAQADRFGEIHRLIEELEPQWTQCPAEHAQAGAAACGVEGRAKA